MMTEVTIAVIDGQSVVFPGTSTDVRARLNQLGIVASELTPTVLTAPLSNEILTAFEYVRQYGPISQGLYALIEGNPSYRDYKTAYEAFCQAISLFEALYPQVSVQFYVDRAYQHYLSHGNNIVTLTKVLREESPWLSIKQAREIITTALSGL